jgi:formate hydrogenlyase subunit 3/multisubunit Na+/H+ antiporter MnhD subunit
LNLLVIYLIVDGLINTSANLKPVIVVLIVVLIGLNFQRYNKVKPYEKLKDLWKEEQKEAKKKRGWFIILYIIISVLLPIAYGFIKHNLIGGKSFLG